MELLESKNSLQDFFDLCHPCFVPFVVAIMFWPMYSKFFRCIIQKRKRLFFFCNSSSFLSYSISEKKVPLNFFPTTFTLQNRFWKDTSLMTTILTISKSIVNCYLLSTISLFSNPLPWVAFDTCLQRKIVLKKIMANRKEMVTYIPDNCSFPATGATQLEPFTATCITEVFPYLYTGMGKHG